MKYNRNWASDTTVEVDFECGKILCGTATTNNKGQLIRVILKGVCYEAPFDTLKEKGVKAIHFRTPAILHL